MNPNPNPSQNGPPAVHPSLPPNPAQYAAAFGQQYNASMIMQQNFYTQLQATHSSHYAQAYAPQPGPLSFGYYLPPSLPQLIQPPVHSIQSWYQPGSMRCNYRTCTFTGSAKALETHKMDRHLIFPPDWDRRKRETEWDTDPSLKGKPVPILGTSIVLDSPEVLDAWIAERKKRWPSAARVQELRTKREEALARGQVSVDDPSLLGKRRRHEEDMSSSSRGFGRQDFSKRGRGSGGRWRGRGKGIGRGGKPEPVEIPQSKGDIPQPLSIEHQTSSDSSCDSTSSDSDSAPEVESSKALDKVMAVQEEPKVDQVAEAEESPTIPTKLRRRTPQPKKQPVNPFATRPNLLRNLLLPEIRVTISNLSQAIRFLVDNDFLEGVELKPGQADERLIQVLGEEQSTTTSEREDVEIASS